MTNNNQMAFNLSTNDVYSVDWVHSAKYTKDWNIKRTVFRPPPSYIKEIIDYNPDTGKLYWKERKGANSNTIFNSRYAGKEINFAKHKRHGTSITIQNMGTQGKKVTIFQHHIAWCIFYGEWPDPSLVIDHINGNYRDNRIVNLRLVTTQENSRNRSLPKANTSGHQGVYLNKRNGRWIAVIHNRSERISLGTFANKEEAIAVRKAAEKEYGYHENHGRAMDDVREKD